MGLANAARILSGIILGAGVVAGAVRTSDALLRPPGALDEADFLSKCVKCGRCMEACPYRALVTCDDVIGPAVGTPTLDVRDQACRLCEDFPCIAACPTGALAPLERRRNAKMGTAVILREHCLAVKGLRCEVCYRACPFIDDAIRIDYSMREGDDLHAVFEPVVNPHHCTGCGLCVERCVASDPVAVEIVRDYDTALARIEEEQGKDAGGAWTAPA